MKISVITPTCNRQFGINLAEKYMARQTVMPDEWIVADGGDGCTLSMGQIHSHEPMAPGHANLASNILRALELVTGDYVIIWEDDDWYSNDHINTCVNRLDLKPMFGCGKLHYYNVAHRSWRAMKNDGAALCQTAFHADQIPRMIKAAQDSMRAGDYRIDGRFWQGKQHMAVGPMTTIGIKGLPGQKGLGIGHRPDNFRWSKDVDGTKLRQWIGEDADNYA